MVTIPITLTFADVFETMVECWISARRAMMEDKRGGKRGEEHEEHKENMVSALTRCADLVQDYLNPSSDMQTGSDE